jgi:hypothetical protein
MLENGDPNVAVKLEIQETPKMSGHHGYQSVTQKLALQKFAIENPTPGMYLQDYAKFVGVFRECWERSMPCFQTVEYGILYCYESTSFGSDVINMECSSKFKGMVTANLFFNIILWFLSLRTTSITTIWRKI